MSLDEAIRYYSHLADECRRKADIERNDYMDLKDLTVECEQLVDWLNELKVLREKIQKLLEKQEQDGWIPVTERLPEENGRYIICYEDATTFLDYFNGKWFFPLGKHAMACEETGTIIAWRPLPEPYTEEEL